MPKIETVSPVPKLAVSFVLLVLVLLAARPATAIPVFAHRYGLTCQTCHTEIPHLTPFGAAFLAGGYRIAGLRPGGGAFPIAVRTDLAYASGGAADPDAIRGPLPKAIVDEVELLTGGAIGTRGSYWAEQYVVDGGFAGSTRDVYVADRFTPDGAAIPVSARVGQFTLPLPLDPETFRETTQPYAIWNQTAGANPFTLFDAKVGLQVQIGDPSRAIAGTANLLRAHDAQSGLPTYGFDTMFSLQRDLGNFRLGAYRYDGAREIAGPAFDGEQHVTGVSDRFWRNGYFLGWARTRTEVDAVYQNGSDAAADVYGDALQTSGAFVQARQSIGERAFAIARYEGTQGASFGRSFTGGIGTRLSRNTRMTLFDTQERDFRNRSLNVVSSALVVAY